MLNSGKSNLFSNSLCLNYLFTKNWVCVLFNTCSIFGVSFISRSDIGGRTFPESTLESDAGDLRKPFSSKCYCCIFMITMNTTGTFNGDRLGIRLAMIYIKFNVRNYYLKKYLFSTIFEALQLIINKYSMPLFLISEIIHPR